MKKHWYMFFKIIFSDYKSNIQKGECLEINEMFATLSLSRYTNYYYFDMSIKELRSYCKENFIF